MEFENIHVDTDCICTDDAAEDVESIYVRKISNQEIADKDLKSSWEKKKQKEGDCHLICAYKGLSINIWNEDSRKSVIDKFLNSFGISQTSGANIYIFKFKENAGILKHTPRDGDAHHYTFYKSDDFTVGMLEKVEVKELRSFLK
jgi:hypothetical protein